MSKHGEDRYITALGFKRGNNTFTKNNISPSRVLHLLKSKDIFLLFYFLCTLPEIDGQYHFDIKFMCNSNYKIYR